MIIRILIVMLCMVQCAIASEDYSELKRRADDYWRQIQRITADEFGRFNIELSVTTAYSFTESLNQGRGASVGLTVPLYSKKDKIANRLAAQSFSERGSLLIKEFKESVSNSEIIKEECRYSESIMPEYGVEAVKAFFDCKRRHASSLLTVEQKERDIRSLIDPYLKKGVDPEIIRTGGQ